MKKKALIEYINSSELCCGCGLCQAIAVPQQLAVKIDQAGFFRPEAPQALESNVQDSIRQICPGLTLRNAVQQNNYDLTWGPLVELRQGHALDPEMRFRAASGGALSALLVFLLEAGKVDFVVHVGASSQDPIVNEVKMSRSKEDVLLNASSRYSPSAPLAAIDQLLREPGRFAVVGKPCDISALRSYASLNTTVQEKVPYMISFFCGGIPSVSGTRRILQHFEVDEADLHSVCYRGQGWPGKLKIELKDGLQHEMSYAESWGTILNRALQLRCKICSDSVGDFADVVFGDAWHLDKQGNPSFEEREGRSLVITRSDRGEQLIRDCLEAGYIRCEPITCSDLNKMQPYQARRKKLLLARLLAMLLWLRPLPKFNFSHLLRAACCAGLVAQLKSFGGMFLRAGKLNRKT